MILNKCQLFVEEILFCKDFLWFTADIIPTSCHKNWHMILFTIIQIRQVESIVVKKNLSKIIHICITKHKI